MSYNYVILEHAVDDRLCSLNPPENIEKAYELNYGVSRADNFPPNALFHMNPEFKRAIKLSDSLHNVDFLFVASKRLKQFLESENVPNNEYLPVTIINHKGRAVDDEYFIVHQVGTQDCIDQSQSEIDWNLINPDQISSVDSLVINETRIDPQATLFRAKHLPNVIFMHRDLADKIAEAAFTGIRFEEIDEYEEV